MLRLGGRVLIHCAAGIHGSAVCAIIIRAATMAETWEEAKREVESSRAVDIDKAIEYWNDEGEDVVEWAKQKIKSSKADAAATARDYWPTQKWGFVFPRALA